MVSASHPHARAHSPSRAPVRILLTGATGYIGGSVLARLLTHPRRAHFDIVSFSRNAERAKALAARFGVETVLGTYDDVAALEDAASGADVVIHTGSSQHIPAAQAILRGLRRRHASTGSPPHFIHTSGTAQFIDDACGSYRCDVIFRDTNVAQVKAVPDEAIHRAVDLVVLDGDQEGYVHSYIVQPSVVYGLASGPLVAAGLADRQSIAIPSLIQGSAARGRPGIFGTGTNVLPFVHIDDMADLYITLLDAILNPWKTPGHGWQGFYFGENGFLPYVDVSHSIGKALVQLGHLEPGADTPTQFLAEEVSKYFAAGFGYIYGTNCHTVGARARALGWKPRYTAEDCHATILPEVDFTLSCKA